MVLSITKIVYRSQERSEWGCTKLNFWRGKETKNWFLAQDDLGYVIDLLNVVLLFISQQVPQLQTFLWAFSQCLEFLSPEV